MAPKVRTAQENVSLGPSTREGENVFGVCHIFASFNDSEWSPTSAATDCINCRTAARAVFSRLFSCRTGGFKHLCTVR